MDVFLTEGDELFEKCSIIWEKVSYDIKKEFDGEPAYDKEFLETKIKFYLDETTDHHEKEILKAGSDYTCLAVVIVDSALKKDENCYPQAFLKECKYTEKEKKWLDILLGTFFASDSDEE